MIKYLFLAIFTLHTQDIFAVCLSKKLTYDLACKCQGNKSCYSAYNKNYAKNRNKALLEFGKDGAKKLAGLTAPGIRQVDSVFDGSFDYKTYDYSKNTDVIQKLISIQKKMEPKVEANLKKLGFKEYRLEKRKERLKMYLEKAIPKDLKLKFKKEGFKSTLASNPKSINRQNVDVKINKPIAKLTRAEMAKLSPKDLELRLRLEASQRAKNLRSSKKFKVTKLYNQGDDIFRNISKRYQMIFMDTKKVAEMLEVQKKEKLKKSFRFMIDKLKRTR